MSFSVNRFGRDGGGLAVAALARWAPRHGYTDALHVGDIGWHLRLDDAQLVDSILVVHDEDRDEVAAVGLVEPATMRLALSPDHLDDQALAGTLADVAADLSDGQAWTDAPYLSALRSELATRGWVLDDDPWCIFYKALGADDAAYDDPQSAPVRTTEDATDRVAVQAAAFEGSTFTLDRWRQMTAGPGYLAELDILRRDTDGTPVAAATGWAAGPGRTGILEPVGTHREHTGAGHGVAVARAAMAALARQGASGVCVATPAGNTAAVAAYARCGLTVVEQLQAMMRPA